MRNAMIAAGVVAAAGFGFLAGRATPAAAGEQASAVSPASPAAGDHADHDMSAMPPMDGFQQQPNIPAGATTAAARLQSSPRHAEWVAIKVNATDSVMAWVVYPERSTKAPVVEGFGLRGFGSHSTNAEYILIPSIEPRLYLATRMIMDIANGKAPLQ